MGASGSKQATIPVAPAAPPAPAPAPAPVPVPAAPVEEDRYGFLEPEDEEEEKVPVPTVEEVIQKLREANEMLQVIAEKENPPREAPARFVGGKKKRSKQQKGGFLDPQQGIMNTSGLIQASHAPSNPTIDLRNLPNTTFSGSGASVVNQMPPMVDPAVYQNILPFLGMTGGAKKARSRRARKAPEQI